MTFSRLSWSMPRLPRQPAAKPFKHLQPGARYHVVKPFVDYDGADHPVGERWTFAGSNFLPYDDGLSLFVTDEDGRMRHILLQ